MQTVKSPIAAQILRITYHTLIGLIRFGAIEPPARDSSGHYAWDDESLRRAREALSARQQRRQAAAHAS
jgi:hypothetical protein